MKIKGFVGFAVCVPLHERTVRFLCDSSIGQAKSICVFNPTMTAEQKLRCSSRLIGNSVGSREDSRSVPLKWLIATAPLC